MVVVLFLGGGQMFMLGVIGEYIWRGLDESRQRPRYLIERITGDSRPDAAHRIAAGLKPVPAYPQRVVEQGATVAVRSL